MSFKTQRGFTLIQLFVIIIFIAVVTLTTFTYFQTRTENIRVEKTALAIEAILEAALAYHLVNGQWPETYSVLLDDNFLPTLSASIGGNNNPWAQPYTLAPGDGLNGNTVIVSTDVLTTTVASELAGRLPNTEVSGSTVSVTLNLYASPPEDPIIVDITNITYNEGENCYFNLFTLASVQVCTCFSDYQARAETVCAAMNKTANYMVALQSWTGGKTDVAGIEVGNVFYTFTLQKTQCSTSSGGTANVWGAIAIADNEVASPSFEAEYLFVSYCS